VDVGLIHIIYNIFNYNNTILYIIILYIAKNEKIKKNPLKNSCDFLTCFSTNLVYYRVIHLHYKI